MKGYEYSRGLIELFGVFGIPVPFLFFFLAVKGSILLF